MESDRNNPQEDFKLKCFQTEFLPDTVKLLQYLWGNDAYLNMDYFKWKYFDNPSSDYPMGIVAFHKGEIVGFRGYFASMWQFSPKKAMFKILSLGDTCVHPDYRRKGLSVAMGKLGIEEFSSECKIFFNWSSSKNSYPGYARLEFIPLIKKTYMTKGSLFHTVQFFRDARRKSKRRSLSIRFGTFHNITVSDNPNPADMYEVLLNQNHTGNTFIMNKNMEYLNWRFNNRRNKYIFYTLKKNSLTVGYLVIRISSSNQRGYIIDHEESISGAIETILRYIIEKKHFNLLSIFTYGVKGNLYQTLIDLQFRINSPLRLIERKVWGDVPLLVRPAKLDYGEKDILLYGQDIRKHESWCLKEICSDGT